MSGGFVYFITREPGDMVKIGWAKTSPHSRLKLFQTGCPDPLDLIAYFPGSREDEARLHKTFAALGFRSEWFYNEHKLQDFIDYLTEGEPGTHACTRQRFEDAVWDVLVSGGYDYPFLPDLEAYRNSADGSRWRHLFSEESLH